jgi:hypothetical protein
MNILEETSVSNFGVEEYLHLLFRVKEFYSEE